MVLDKSIETIDSATFVMPKPLQYENKIFNQCNFKEYSFYKCKIENCTFNKCDLSESNLGKSIITNCTFTDCNLQFCNMLKIKIFNCTFIRCNLWHSNLCHSSIVDSSFSECILRCLYKEVNWYNNDIDKYTVIESCGGAQCKIGLDVVFDVLNQKNKNVTDLIDT